MFDAKIVEKAMLKLLITQSSKKKKKKTSKIFAVAKILKTGIP